MAVAVNQPNRRDERDPLETIVKGLQIAGSIYGIKEGREKAQLLAEQSAREVESKKASLAMEEGKMRGQGFDKQADGTWLVPPGYKNLADRKTEAEIKKLEAEATRKGTGDPLADEMKHQRLADYKRKTEEAAFKKTPEGRLQGLASGDKQRLDNAKLGLTSVQGMADALLVKGQNTFSPFGDNDFTQQRGLFKEALGRMQSGGAIGEKEADEFMKLAPTWTDSKEIQQKKLVQLQSEMASRLGTLGFTPDQLGVQLSTIGSPEVQGDPSIFAPSKANAGPALPDISPDNAMAELMKRKGLQKARLPK